METETPRFVVNIEAAVHRNGDYLLAQRATTESHAAGMWSLIGGTVEGADGSQNVFETTVRRELEEEVGITVTDLAYVTSSAFETDTGDAALNVVYLAEYAAGEPRVREPDELAAVQWRSIDSILGDDSVPTFTQTYVEQAEERRQQRAEFP